MQRLIALDCLGSDMRYLCACAHDDCREDKLARCAFVNVSTKQEHSPVFSKDELYRMADDYLASKDTAIFFKLYLNTDPFFIALTRADMREFFLSIKRSNHAAYVNDPDPKHFAEIAHRLDVKGIY